MSVYALTINGTSRALLHDSMTIVEGANGRNTMVCDILEPTTYRPALFDTVTVTEDAVTIFSGYIIEPVESGFGGIGWATITTRISCADWSALADRRYVSGSFGPGTTKQLLQQSLSYLSIFGVTLDPTQGDGPAVPEFICDDRQLSDLYNEVSNVVNGVWDITYGKLLKMTFPGDVAAPFNIVAGDGNVIGDVTVEPVTEEYANRIILRYSAGARASYAFLTFNANPINDDRIILGGGDYFFKTTLTGAANQIKIGATLAESAENLVATIMHDPAGAGTKYTAATPANPSAWAYIISPGVVRARAIQSGDVGNSIAANSTTANIVWHDESGAIVTALYLGTDADPAERVVAEDVGAQGVGQINLVEKVVSKTSVFTRDVAVALANAELQRSLGLAKKIEYVTYRTGVHPGQTQTITLPLRNLSGSFLITDVRIQNVPGDTACRRTVTAYTQGQMPTRWQNDVAHIMAGSTVTGAPLVGAPVSSVPSVSQSRPWYTLGANAYEWVSASTAGAWVPASAIQITIDTALRGTTDATVTVRLRAASSGVGVTARLYNVTDNVSVGTSATVTSTDYVTVTFAVTLTAGVKTYELQIQPSAANEDVNAVGSLE